MFDVSGFELLVVAIVALIAVGPKELPRLMHTLGRWAAKGRNATNAFTRALSDIEKESKDDPK